MPGEIDFHYTLRTVVHAIGMVNPALCLHQKRTACLFKQIAVEAGYDPAALRTGYIAAMLHDIGALCDSARWASLATADKEVSAHARTGSEVLRRIPILQAAADVVSCHQVWWCNRSSNIPEIAHVLYLADRIDVLLNSKSEDYLTASLSVRRAIQADAGRRFSPRCVEAFTRISAPADFWLSLEVPWLSKTVDHLSPIKNEKISLSEFHQLARLLASIVDTHSRSTYLHSQDVEGLCFRLGKMMGFNPEQCLRLSIAGLLHDIGKLAIPETLLDKIDPLTIIERRYLQRHSWLTHQLLSGITGVEDIAIWAGYHHEWTDGTGYPFGLSEDELPLECRIITIADIWCALTEARSYRKAMTTEQAMEIMSEKSISLRDIQIVNALKTIVIPEKTE